MMSMSSSGVLHPNQTKENAELRRHVKRRTQALDTIRRAYIVDVDRLKRGLQDQVSLKGLYLHHHVKIDFVLKHVGQIRCVPTDNISKDGL